MQHVPYRGAQAATQDLIGGPHRGDVRQPPSAAPHIRSGNGARARGRHRPALADIPEIPTIAEQATAGWSHQLVRHRGFGALPDDIVTKMHAELLRALQAPAVVERFDSIGRAAGR